MLDARNEILMTRTYRLFSFLFFSDKILRPQFFVFVLCIGLLPAFDWSGVLTLYLGRETARGQARNNLFGQERRTRTAELELTHIL